jgi:hypothetical protein
MQIERKRLFSKRKFRVWLEYGCKKDDDGRKNGEDEKSEGRLKSD